MMEDFRESPDKPSLRIRTHDDMVEVIETRPGSDGDFDQSVRVFGPFETADEQREFMRSVYKGASIESGNLAAVLAIIDNWKRFDE